MVCKEFFCNHHKRNHSKPSCLMLSYIMPKPAKIALHCFGCGLVCKQTPWKKKQREKFLSIKNCRKICIPFLFHFTWGGARDHAPLETTNQFKNCLQNKNVIISVGGKKCVIEALWWWMFFWERKRQKNILKPLILKQRLTLYTEALCPFVKGKTCLGEIIIEFEYF